MLRFIHAADLHLDSPFKGMKQLPTAIRSKIIQSTFVAFERMIERAIVEQVDFLIIAGDVFDSAERSLKAQIRFHKGVQKCSEAGIACYIAHGNHDPLDGLHIPQEWPENVHFFAGDRVTAIPFYRDGRELAMIQGMSYPTAKVEENLALRFQRASDSFSIAVLHTNCGGVGGHGNYAPSSKKDLLAANVDYWALGHVHTRRIVEESPLIIYPGNIQGRHIGEQGEKGFYLVEVDQYRKSSPTFIPVQELLWLQEELNLTGIEGWQELVAAMLEIKEELRRKYKKMSVIVRLIGKGESALYAHLQEEESREALLQEWNLGEGEEADFIWLEDFRCEGYAVINRAEIKQGETIMADLIEEVDHYLTDATAREVFIKETLQELFTHQRAKRFIEEWSKDEQEQLLREAEALVLHEIEGEARR